MPLIVVAGLPGDGVGQRMLDAVSDAARAGRTAVLAVPSDQGAVRARESLAGGDPVGVRVATLDGLVQAEWALAGDGRRLARGLGRDVLLARALVSAGVAEDPGSGAVRLLGSLVERTPLGSGGARADGLPGRLLGAIDAYHASLAGHHMVEIREVCQLLAATPPPASVIAVDAFVGLRPEHETLLRGWSAGGAQVFLSVPWANGSPGTAASTPLVERLAAAGAEVDEVSPAGDRPPELRRVREELFTGAPPGTCQGAIALVVAEGEEAEARSVAATVASLIASGSDPDTIVIAFGDPARHGGWTRRALDGAGVPADLDTSVGVGETAFGAALLRLGALAAGGFDRGDLTALLRTPFFGVALDHADAADVAWRSGGRAGGRSLLRRVKEADCLVQEFLRLRDLPVGVEEAKKWKNLADRLLAGAHPGAAPTVHEDGAQDAAVHREFCRHLTEAVELGSGEVSASELWQRFSVARISPQKARRPGRVLVTGIDSVPDRACAHVIIGGLTAAELPRRGSGEVLEGDSVVRAMSRLGIVIDQEEHAREERRAFYLAATTASRTLTLTRQGTSDEGAPVRESVFWDEFLDLYRAPGDPLPECEPPLLRVAPLDAGTRCGEPRRPRGQLRDGASLLDLAARTEELSPSQIETYLTCPYRWFIERKVRAQAPDVTVDRAAAGRIAHDALARFYRVWRERAPRVTHESRDEAMQTAAQAVAAATRAATPAGTLEEAALIGAVGPSVVALVGRDAGFLPEFEPAHVEWAFGGGSDLPAIDIGGVSLKGRADRIDVGPEGLIVVDYKRTHASTLAQIRREGLVQLQLYGAAASRVLGVPVAGGLYRSLKDGSDRGFVLSGVTGAFKAADVIERDELDALLDAALESARRVAGEMREGRIEPTPSAEACRYCSASAFCGKVVPS